ncbi:MAG: hypothetical protein ACT4PL_14840 [Phycisphaerales bacterium]
MATSRSRTRALRRALGALALRLSAARLAPFALGLCTLALPLEVAASSVVHATPEQTLARADAIFQGTVVAARFDWTDARQVFATTEYTVRIDRVDLDRAGLLAGRTHDGHTNLSIMGGTQNGVRYIVSGMPQFAIGESAVFMLSAANIQNNAMSPLVGDSEGYFPIRAVNGEWIVHTPGGCLGPSRPVDFRYFTKFRDPQMSYTPETFATEIARALPIAEASPELRATTPAPLPAHLTGSAFGPSEQGDLLLAPPGPAAPAQATTPLSAGGPIKPQPPERRFSTAELVQDPERNMLEYGFPAGVLPPGSPVAFNVPPGTWWRQAFFDEQNRWNRYAPGLFQVFADSNNQIGWPNGRNETGFLNNQQMVDLYGRGWGATTLARCITRTFGLALQVIVESDIAYNPTQVFSENQGVIYADSTINSFRATALHELGHAFGRVHSWESNPGFVAPSCMNYFTTGFYDAESDRVFADDAESIRAAYGGINLTDFGITLWRMSGTLVPFGASTSVNGVVGLNMPPSVLQGNAFPIYEIRLENIGTNTRATTIDWWLDPTPYDFNLSGAIYCSSTNLGTLDRASGVAVSTFVVTPNSVPPGQYYLCAIINEDDAHSDNDFAWSQNRIRVDYNPAFAPPSNDSRNTPRSIGLGTVSGSTQFATQDGTTTCGSSNTTPDVWFTMVAPYAGSLEADTCGSVFDTVLSVERRQLNPVTGGFSYVQLTCNDDAAIGNCGGTTRSRISATVSASDLLRFRLSGFNGARGNYVLNTRIYPANDFCAQAVPVTNGSYTATLSGATNDRTGSCGLSQTTPDVWFRYTWPQGCNTVTFDTYGSNFDTVLEVLPVCSAFNITALACNDDCGAVGPSCVTVSRGAETTLRIRVTNYGGNTPPGNFITLNVSTPAPFNDNCVAAVVIPDGDFAFNSSCGTADPLPLPASCGSTPCEGDFWFTYTAPITGFLSVNAAAAFPVAVAIYPGAACPGDPEQSIACSVGPSGAGAGIAIGAGETVILRIGGVTLPGSPFPIGPGTFSVHTTELPPANDACEAAEGVVAGQVVTGNLTLAIADGASTADRAVGGPDVWYGFVAPADGTLSVTTCGTLLGYGLDTVVSIHAACPGDTLTEVIASDVQSPGGCPADDPETVDPEDAGIELPVVAGTPYFIRIAATDPALIGTGSFTARIGFTSPGDSCATLVDLPEGNSFVSTAGATPDGPAHECFDGAEPDVWFLFSASCTGTMRISTCGQPNAAKLAVYSTSCPDAEALPIACNAGDGPECPGAAPSLEFPCEPGVNYILRLAGDLPAASLLSLTCVPAPGNPLDFNNDGFVEPGDLDEFITSFFSDNEEERSRCDFNQDGFVEPGDLDEYITSYFNQ